MPPSIGIIVNPSSGRDIRRLLSRASVFPNGEKINIVLRLLAGLGALGVAEALLMRDEAGVAASIRREAGAQKGAALPEVRLLEMPVEGTAEDTRRAVVAMAERGVAAIVVLGGDGTHRIVAAHCGQIPLLALSTGTNNAFPELREATTAGLALGLLVSGRVPPALALRRNKLLRVSYRGREEIALVDVCVAHQPFLGARALWQPADLSRIFVTFADPRNIGLTAIVAWSLPISRGDPWGGQVRFGPGGGSLLAPIAPGLVERIELAEAARLPPDEPVGLPPSGGTIALDGERALEIDPGHPVTVRLDLAGPLTVNVDAVLAYAARQGLLLDSG